MIQATALLKLGCSKTVTIARENRKSWKLIITMVVDEKCNCPWMHIAPTRTAFCKMLRNLVSVLMQIKKMGI